MIWYEWVDEKGQGALSSYPLQVQTLAKLDERMDRIEALRDDLSFDSRRGLIFPCTGELKKLKANAQVALRPIVHVSESPAEVTFLLVVEERDNKYPAGYEKKAKDRLAEIRANPKRRKRYERATTKTP